MHSEIQVPYFSCREVVWKFDTLRKKPLARWTPARTRRWEMSPTPSHALCVPSRYTLVALWRVRASTAPLRARYRSAGVAPGALGLHHSGFPLMSTLFGMIPRLSGSRMTTAGRFPMPAANALIHARYASVFWAPPAEYW